MGRSLDDAGDRLSWSDLRAYLTAPPPGSLLAQARGLWSPQDHLLTVLLQSTRLLSWQLSGDRRIPAPTYLSVSEILGGGDSKPESSALPYGKGMPIEEMRARLGLQ